MSKTGEILRRFEKSTFHQDDSSLAKRAETSQLWPRFLKIFDAVAHAFGDQPPPEGITREFSTFNWSGVDDGIHDHNGLIRGRINGIELHIKLKGTTVDHKQKSHQEQYRERDVYFEGTFISADGEKGAVEMQHENDAWRYKAFWLETHNGVLQLEQVVGLDGIIYDAYKLEPDKNEVTIPGTHTAVPRLKELF